MYIGIEQGEFDISLINTLQIPLLYTMIAFGT